MSRRSAEAGCGLMTLIVSLLVVLFWVMFIAAIFDLGVFA